MKLPIHPLRLLAGMLLALGITIPAMGQPTLERLEKSIREGTAGEGVPAAAPQPAASVRQQAGYLGLTADDANDRGRGVRVLAVRTGGPAATAGLKANDLITAIAGVRVRQMSDMAEIMAMFPAGDVVAFDVQRDGKQQQVKVTLGKLPGAKEAVKEAVEMPAKAPAKPQAAPVEPPDAGPKLAPPAKTVSPPPAAPPTVEQLQRRIEELERRVEQLEKALAEARKKPE